MSLVSRCRSSASSAASRPRSGRSTSARSITVRRSRGLFWLTSCAVTDMKTRCLTNRKGDAQGSSALGTQLVEWQKGSKEQLWSFRKA